METYTDNPRNTPNTFSDLITHLSGGTSLSIDSRRIQGQFNGNLDYQKYARASDLDTLNANLAAFALGTVVPEHIFVDGRAAITQLSGLGGVGFGNSTLIPPSQQTQTFIVSATPIARGSLNGYVDGEVRYNFAMQMFQNGSLLNNSATAATSPTLIPPSALGNTTENDATLTLATGRRFNFFGSKLTLGAGQQSSQSATQSQQVRAYDDLEYAFNREFAATGRAGFEDLRYPLQPSASTIGPTWLIGGRYTPFPGSYLVIRYGRVSGFYGFSGAARYQATAATVISASVTQNLASSEQQLTNTLNTSQLDQNGVIVDQYSGLPNALSNPEFAFSSTAVYRSKEAKLSVQTSLDRNTFGVFVFLDQRKQVAPPIGVTGLAAVLAGSDTSLGANLNWSRTLTPNLTSTATLGYSIRQIGNGKTINADWLLSYTVSEHLNATLHYQFIDSSTNIAAASYTRNQIEIGLNRSF